MSEKSEFIVIDFPSREFIANGKTFYIEHDRILTGRYQKFEEMGISFAFGSTFGDIFQSLKKIYDATTSGNDVLKGITTAQTVAYNQMQAIKRHDENYKPHILWFCTLFCNYENEDRKVWSEEVARRKIADWERSSIPITDFFLLAANVLHGYGNAYNLMSVMDQMKKGKKANFFSKKAKF